jgi:LAO/AO transport system kinase
VKGPIDVVELAARIATRDPATVARAISIVEDRRSASEPRTIALLRALDSEARRRSHRVGITGPPGVGKSSLVSVLARATRARERTVGVLAVDPSSPRTGGALLGDRARIEVDPRDLGLFVRSMASGGHLGGLARAAGAAVDVLSAVYDVVFVETTGVGQSETDVEHVTDTVVLVVQPASGDVLQFLKAGILEIPDIIVVNKIDLGTVADRALAELRSAINTIHSAGRVGWDPPVLATGATTGHGIEALIDATERHRAELEASGTLMLRRRRAAAAWALRFFTQRHGEIAVENAGGAASLLARLEQRVAEGATAVEAVADAAAVTMRAP